MWRFGPVLNYQKVPKYYDRSCSFQFCISFEVTSPFVQDTSHFYKHVQNSQFETLFKLLKKRDCEILLLESWVDGGKASRRVKEVTVFSSFKNLWCVHVQQRHLDLL